MVDIGFIIDLHSDSSMRTHNGTLTALNTEFALPNRNMLCNCAFFILSRRSREGTVCRNFTYLYRIAFIDSDFTQYFADKFRRIGAHCGMTGKFTGCFFGIRNLFNPFKRHIDGLDVLLNNFRPLLPVRFFDKFLNQRYRFIFGQNTGNFKECGLHNNVDTVAHARFFRNLYTVDNVELRFFRDKVFLYFYRQVLPYLILIPVAVQKEGATFFKALEHIVGFEEGEFMARNKVRLSDKIGLADLFLSEAEMRGSN